MMYHQENGVIVQIGLASFLPSVGCGYGYPSGFIRLSYYVDWIYSVTGIIFLRFHKLPLLNLFLHQELRLYQRGTSVCQQQLNLLR